MGSAQGIIEKSGAWYSYKNERIGQGKENVRLFLVEHPEIAMDIEKQIRERLLPDRKTVASEAAAEREKLN